VQASKNRIGFVVCTGLPCGCGKASPKRDEKIILAGAFTPSVIARSPKESGALFLKNELNAAKPGVNLALLLRTSITASGRAVEAEGSATPLSRWF
jgi:hypothetical protein